MADKTIHTDTEGNKLIYVYASDRAREATAVFVLSRKQRLKCEHDWRPVSREGHGKWQRGCSKCGALSR